MCIRDRIRDSAQLSRLCQRRVVEERSIADAKIQRNARSRQGLGLRGASHELRATKKGATEATPFFADLLSYCSTALLLYCSTDLLLQLHHCAGALEGLL